MRSRLLRRFIAASAVVPAALLSFAAVAAPPGTTADATVRAQPPSAPAPANEPLRDPEILAMLEAIHSTSIDQARSAAKRATDHHVKRFAHAVERRAEDGRRREDRLSKRLNLQIPAGIGGADELRRTLQETFHNLGTMTSGPDFDRSYIQDELAALNHTLTTIDNKLLPSVQTNDLRTELRTVRAEIERDLKKARDVLDRLDRANKPTGP